MLRSARQPSSAKYRMGTTWKLSRRADGLPESQALYEKLGFQTTSNVIEALWDGKRPLIRMELLSH